MPDIDELKDKYKELKIKREFFETTLKSKRRSLTITNIKIKDFEEVHAIWVGIADKIQTSARNHIENTVSMAIQTVFQESFEFKLQFKEERNNITCKPLVVKDGHEYSPKDQMGGGMLDIIGFALRITLWSMRVPRSRNIFILDEPFKFCGDLTFKAGIMLKKLSEKLKFQVLLVTHDDQLKEICDRVWIINKTKFSKLKLLKIFVETVKRKIRRR
jgi:DNA repair exonuclease SbcCD ATPase subunit